MRNQLFTLFLFLTVSLGLTSCATTSSTRAFQSGVASWYGPGFHGKQTANGEKYDQEELTAAHKTLPFNTLVRVMNLDNGKSVVVRINDRGPYAKGRIIDLSRGAAKKLDMLNSGTARVRLFLVRGDAREVNARANSDELFAVQIASYNDSKGAEAKASTVKNAWVKSYKVDGKTVYRVFVGKFNSKEDAQDFAKRLKRDGIDGFVKQL
ncbi:septal ring lytic transglycosylase RlpA family protein [bacterium]|nr:MAG: septal ring lytic transglycosylase RlpA family protein [bacterium]